MKRSCLLLLCTINEFTMYWCKWWRKRALCVDASDDARIHSDCI